MSRLFPTKVGHTPPHDPRFRFHRGWAGLERSLSGSRRKPDYPALVLAGALGMAGGVAPWGLSACAAAPVKVECQEQKLRLDLENLSEDQRRFGEENLRDCEQRLDSAQARDSAFIQKLDRRFTPEAEGGANGDVNGDSADGTDVSGPGLDSAEAMP